MSLSGERFWSLANVSFLIEPVSLATFVRLAFAGSERDLMTNAVDPALSPLFGDMSGLPPLLISVGASEVLLDDAERLAALAKLAHVEVLLDVVPRMPHSFPLFARYFPEAKSAFNRAVDFIRTRFQLTPTREPIAAPIPAAA